MNRASRRAKTPKPSVMSEFGPAVMEGLAALLLEHGYELGEQIGRGGFSAVFRVYSSQYERDFAAKVTNTCSVRHRTAGVVAANEERALKQFNHPHVIRLYDSFPYEQFSILILELCSGRSLSTLIKESSGRPIPHLLFRMREICHALAFLHAHHFVHRDIKPGNVLLDDFGRPKIADFGMCIPCADGEEIHEYIGSPQYAAPELLRQRPYDPYKADVWALGVTFYEMAMGPISWPSELALVKESIIEGGILIDAQTPRTIQKLVQAMTRMNPTARPTLEQVMAHNFQKIPRPTRPMIMPVELEEDEEQLSRAQQVPVPPQFRSLTCDIRRQSYLVLARNTGGAASQ
jgi:serine/threonine protein kinase